MHQKNEIFSIAVIIPCYKVNKHILNVISGIGIEVSRIYVVDDNCPEQVGSFVKKFCFDSRVTVITNNKNVGVGGSVKIGYVAATDDGANVIVKIDGDGQMDPLLVKKIIAPIIAGEADYTKGNRFFDLEEIGKMPTVRLLGNAVLSFITKLSSGYWDIFDPTNGYTAIHSDIVKYLPLDKISNRYFFESDMLFRLNVMRAVVVDVPIAAKYADEESNMFISNIIFEFLVKHTRNFIKRIFYNYYLRDMSIASIELPIGVILVLSGGLFGVNRWLASFNTGVSVTAGTVMLAALPVLLGVQLILAFLGYDIATVPRRPRQLKLNDKVVKFRTIEPKEHCD